VAAPELDPGGTCAGKVGREAQLGWFVVRIGDGVSFVMVFRSVGSVRGCSTSLAVSFRMVPAWDAARPKFPSAVLSEQVRGRETARRRSESPSFRAVWPRQRLSGPRSVGSDAGARRKNAEPRGVVVWFAMSPAPCSSYSATPRDLSRAGDGAVGLASLSAITARRSRSRSSATRLS
jgi:hypothetical protein